MDEAEDIINRKGSGNTERTYRSAWGLFQSWCARQTEEAQGAQVFEPLPATPQVVVLYLTDLAHEHKYSTVQVHLTTINVMHERARAPRPSDEAVVRRFMANLRKEKGTRSDPKDHLTPEHIVAMLPGLDLSTLVGLRDRAVLLFGLALGGRRSELAALTVENISWVPQGMVVLIETSKTDKESAGETLGMPKAPIPEVCPVEAVRAWISAAKLTTGPLFRAIDRHGNLKGAFPDKSVARVVKEGIVRIGLDPKRYAGHSFRSGLATTAAEEGAEGRSIQKRLRHTSSTMTARYVHTGTLFKDNPATQVLNRLAKVYQGKLPPQ